MKRWVSLVLLLLCGVLIPLTAQGTGPRIPTSPWGWGFELGFAGSSEAGGALSLALTGNRDVAKHLALRSALEVHAPLPTGETIYVPCPISGCDDVADVAPVASLSAGIELAEFRNDRGLLAGAGLAVHSSLHGGWYWTVGAGFPVGPSAITIDYRRHSFVGTAEAKGAASLRLGVRLRR